MNKTVQLVTEWAGFEESHPDAGIEEFCRYYLTKQRSKQEVGPNFAGSGIPPHPKSFLMKLIGFLSRATQVYFEKAFEPIGEIRQKEDFYFLNNIHYRGECRKTDVVHEQLLGMTTGIDTLNRLLANALIVERPDPTDKRAKLLRITEKGRAVLERCYAAAQKVNEIMLHNISDDDVQLCIQLLRSVEAKQSVMIFEWKDQPIDVVYEKVVGRKEVQ